MGNSPAQYPHRVEYLRFEPDSPVKRAVREQPHIAFKTDDLQKEITGEQVLLGLVIRSEVKNVGTISAGSYNGVNLVDIFDSIILGNRIWDDQMAKTINYAIVERGTSNRNLIVSNNVRDCLNTILISGAETIVKNNKSYVTENSGTAVGTSPITIHHGLDPSIDPSKIKVTLGAKGEKPLRTSWRINPEDKTKIDIFHDADGEAEIIWSAWV